MEQKPRSIEMRFFGDSLAFIEQNESEIPFDVKRIYWLYNVEPGTARANHAHIQNEQVLVCLHGEVSIRLKSRTGEAYDYSLKSPKVGLYVPPLLWKEITFRQDNGVLLAIASKEFDEGDYIKDFDQFLKYEV